MSKQAELGMAHERSSRSQTIRVTREFLERVEGLGLLIRSYTVTDSADSVLGISFQCYVEKDSGIIVPLDDTNAQRPTNARTD